MRHLGTELEAVTLASRGTVVTGLTGGTDGRVVRHSSAAAYVNASPDDSPAQLRTSLFKQGGRYHRPGSVVTGLSGLTAGDDYYLLAEGLLTATAPNPSASSARMKVGTALSADSLLFRPGEPEREVPSLAASRMAPAQPSLVVSTFQAEHAWVLANPRGTLTFPTTGHIFGTRAAQVVTDGSGLITGLASPTFSPMDFRGKLLRFWVWIDDSTRLSQLVLYVSHNNFTAWRTYNVAVGGTGNGRTLRDNTWVPITVLLDAPATETGTVDMSAVTNVRFSVFDNGNPLTIRYNEVALLDKQPGAVAVVFDDALSSVYTVARPILERYGIRASVAVIPQLVGASGAATLSQLQDLQRYQGWDIIAHHYSDLAAEQGFDTMSEAQLRAEVEALQGWMRDHGFHRGVHHVAYPFGGWSQASLDVLRDYFVTGRTIVRDLETNPPADPMLLRSYNVVSTDSTTTLQNAIASAVSSGALLILTFHGVVSGTPAAPSEYNAANLETVMAYLRSSGARVVTMSELSELTLPGSYAPLVHAHTTGQVTGLDAALAGKSNVGHGHATSEVTGLDTALAGKASTSHTHNASAIDAGTLAVARGGTGISSYTANNYIRASAATTLQQRTPAQVLADIGAVGNGGGAATLRTMTVAAYNALGTKDANTVYVLT